MITPNTTSAACRTLAIHRANLAKRKGSDEAMSVQLAKAAMNDAAREVRAGFTVIS